MRGIFCLSLPASLRGLCRLGEIPVVSPPANFFLSLRDGGR